ncbi:hypothetical protein OGAPHI_004709 [Ogataea philodendri]|uniref:Mitochondrial peculiar membrane protein 1 n=1 Tax=Ogataea philodendri TaxID=1378263 RepID=A0A9P8T3H0_9ASCO|nr:uncharacterized protein OGAPHI_004709 [Ogataea philodendri]KAH3663995.1 hypothetical protein OGAPHI_004709 [Ogataea philodendri]
MGIFNPSDNKNTDTVAVQQDRPFNSSPLDSLNDSLETLFSSANTLTSSSVSNLFDWYSKRWGEKGQEFQESVIGAADQLFDRLPVFQDQLYSHFGRRFRNERTPYGLWAYPVPSPNMYEQCQEVEGLSVWDSTGYWRCLFPRARIPQEFASELSREDVEADTAHEKGVFFQQYTDFLGFKAKMNKLAHEKRKQDWARFKEEQRAKWDFVNDKKDPDAVTRTGTSSTTTIRTLEQGDVEKVTVLKEFFSDGTSSVKETKEVLNPAGERKQFTEETPKSGWFWDSEKK